MLGKFEELVIVLVIVLVLFGGTKLPKLAKGIGESVREVRKGFRGDADPEPTEAQVAASKSTPHKKA